MIEIAHSTLAPDTDPPKGLVPFIVTVFGLTWLLLLPAGLAQRGLIAGPVERFIPIVIIGFWSPTLAALLVARITPGAGGLRSIGNLTQVFPFRGPEQHGRNRPLNVKAK